MVHHVGLLFWSLVSGVQSGGYDCLSVAVNVHVGSVVSVNKFNGSRVS